MALFTNANFYPTDERTLDIMCEGEDLTGKVIYDPSAGSGNIIDYALLHGASEALASENDKDLLLILKTKCRIIAEDFLTVESHQISHIDCIIMNPPFSADEQHITHAFNIAPPGCKIIAICNTQTLENKYTQKRQELGSIIDQHGSSRSIGPVFTMADRKTNVDISLIKLTKPGSNYNAEFDGFFMDEEPEEAQENGIMSYNIVRDLVNRYVQAIKIFDEQLQTAARLNDLTKDYFFTKQPDLAISITRLSVPVKRQEFKKAMQKAGWMFIFEKMNMQKHSTKGLREDINKFVEQQKDIPFTMRNIYHMLEIVIGTASQRMDKAILEVFDRVTEHHHENRHHVKGWKTNSHFLVGKKFILPYMISPAKEYGYTSEYYTSLKESYDGTIPDMEKALCFITGENYADISTVNCSIRRNTYGEWYDSHFFKYKGYKNGNMHFEFMSEEVWALFNQRIAKIKGYPLYEGKAQTAYQDRNTGRATQPKGQAAKPHPQQPMNVLFTFES